MSLSDSINCEFAPRGGWTGLRRSNASAKGHATRKARAATRYRQECDAVHHETLVREIERTLQDVTHRHAPPSEFTEGTANNVFNTSAIVPSDRDGDARDAAFVLLYLAEDCGAIVAEGEGQWRVVNEDALFDTTFKRGVNAAIFRAA